MTTWEPKDIEIASYLKFYKRQGKAATQPKIHLEFERDGKTIDKRGWGSVISGDETFTLFDGTLLGADDLNELDAGGWEILSTYGLFPTEMFMAPGWTTATTGSWS
jgi:hypothetical protein